MTNEDGETICKKCKTILEYSGCGNFQSDIEGAYSIEFKCNCDGLYVFFVNKQRQLISRPNTRDLLFLQCYNA